MANKLLLSQNLISISKAAEFLDISIDTVRRWDKQGILHSTRPDGKNRYFSLSELESIKFQRPLTISELSKKLAISISTIRRLEQEGLIKAKRDNNNQRIFAQKDVSDFVNSEYFLRKEQYQNQIFQPIKSLVDKSLSKSDDEPTEKMVLERFLLTRYQKLIDRFSIFQKIIVYFLIFIVSFTATIIIVLTLGWIFYPQETAEIFGFSQKITLPDKSQAQVLGLHDIQTQESPALSLVGRIFRPHALISHTLAKRIKPEVDNYHIPKDTSSSSLYIDKSSNLKVNRPISFTSQQLQIEDQSVIENLNAEYVAGRSPGSQAGNLAVIDENGGLSLAGDIAARSLNLSGDLSCAHCVTVPDLDVEGLLSNDFVASLFSANIPTGAIKTNMLADGAVTLAKFSSEVLNKATDYLSKDVVKSENIKDGEVKEQDLADGAVTSAKISDHTITAADLAATITFSSSDFLDLSAITHASTASLGLRLPNALSASPSSPSSGEGYIAWDTAGNQVIVYNGLSWTTVSGGGSSLFSDAGIFTYLTATSDDLVLGDSTVSGSSFFFDESAGYLYLGTDNTLSGGLTFYAGAAATTDATITTNTSGDLILNAGGLLDIADATISLTAGTTVTLQRNSTTSDVLVLNNIGAGSLSLNLSDGGLQTAGTERLTNAGALLNITGLTVSSGTVSLPAGQIDNSELANSSLTVSAGTGLSGGGAVSLGGSTTLSVNQDTAFAWTNAQTYTFAGTENLGVTSDLAGTVNVVSITGTPSGTAGTTRGLLVQQANSVLNTNGLDTAILIDNADLDLALATAIQITNSGGGGYTTLLDTPSLDISGGGAITGATGITSSGTITFSGLTTAGPVITSAAGVLSSEANLAVARGGTGAGTFTINGVLYGNGTGALQVTAAGTSGQLLVANASGVPTFVTMGTDATLAASGALTISADAVALATDTTGNYIATIASGSGISVSGSGTENAAATVALAALTANWNQTGGFDLDLNNSSSELRILESGVSPTFFAIFDAGDLSADATLTLNSGITLVGGGNTLTLAGNLTTSGANALTFTTTAATSVTLPTSGTIATLAGTETLTNKTIGSTGLTFSGATTDITTAVAENLTLTAATTGDVEIATDADTTFAITGLTNCDTIDTNASGVLACGTDATGGGGAWSGLTAPTANLTLSHSAFTTTMNWTATGALDAWTDNFTNNASTATTQRALSIVNAATSQTVDVNTEALLRLDNADTSAAGSTVVDDAILITNSGGITSGVTDAIDASATEIVNALNAGPNTILGTTAVIDFTNFDVSSAGAVTAVGINSGTGLLQGTGGLTITGAANINTSGANATNIGTGTNTGTITIGNSAGGDLVLNDPNWSITGAGAATVTDLICSSASCISTGEITANTIDWGDIADATTLDAATTIASTLAATSLDLNVSPAGTATAPIGLEITPTWGIDITDQTLIGLNINASTNSNTDAGDVLQAINIAAITATAGTETAVVVGSGWDNALTVAGTAIINGSGVVQSAGLSGTYSNTLTLSNASNSITVGTLTATGGTINGVSVGATTPSTGAFTTLSATGNINFDDTSADTILIGQSGATDDTVTIAGDLSLTDDQWSISATGVVSGLSGTNTGLTVGDLSCTNCIGGTEIDESTFGAITTSGTLTFSAVATDITTGANEALTLSPNGTGDIVLSVDNDTNISFSATLTGTSAQDLLSSTLTNQTTAGTQRGVVITNADDAANAVTEALIELSNAEGTASTVTDAILIAGTEATGIDTIVDAIDVSDNNITNAINIGANAIAGTNFSVTGAGAVTAASLTSAGAIAANGGITFDAATDTVGAHTLSGTLDANTNILTNIGNAGTDFIATTGGLTLAGDFTLSNNTLVCTACVDVTDIGANAVDDSELVDALTYTGGLTLTPSTTSDFTVNLDADSQAVFSATVASDVTFNLADLTITGTATADTGTLIGLAVRNLNEAGTTGSPDSLIYAAHSDANETVTNGLLIENTSTGTLTNAIQIAETAGTITDGILITGTLGNILNSGSIDITGAGVITGATGVTIASGGLTVTAGGATITAGALAVNSDSITSDGLLDINGTSGVQVTLPAGTVDFTVSGLDADSTVTFSGLNSCDTIDTTAAGVLVCGTDAGAGASPFSTAGGVITKATTTDVLQLTMAQAGDYGLLVDTSVEPTVDLVQVNSANAVAATSGVDALAITYRQATNVANITGSALDITIAAQSGDAGDTIRGITINNITAGASTETALAIGTGWDTGISVGSGGITVDAGGLTVTAGALAVNSDSITSDGATLTINAAGAVDIQDNLTADQLTTDVGGLSIAAGQSYTGAGAVTLSSAAASGLTINSGTTGTIGVGDDASAETINLGTGAAAKTVTLGSTNTTSSTTIRSGSGNITIAGNTEAVVIDGTNFDVTSAGAVTLTGHLTLSGDASEGLSGGGLVDCDTAATSKLLWDATTNKFSCGTDQTGGGGLPNANTFSDATDTTLGDGGTNIWSQVTYPNLTPTATTSQILVSVQVYIDAVGADDEINVFTIRRAIDADPTCTSTQVGPKFAGAFRTTATEFSSAETSVIDSPASTGNVRYTVCTDADSSGTVDAIELDTYVHLVEVGADLAENYYTQDNTIESADVVSLDSAIPAGAKKSSRPYDSQVIGIVSTKPGAVLDDAMGLGYGKPIPVALIGRVPVKVTTENGLLKQGDLLTSSSTPGVAMRATKAGQIIGQAMTPFEGEGIGLVVAFVKTDYWQGSKLSDLLSPTATESAESKQNSNLGKLILSQFISQRRQLVDTVNLSEIVSDRVAAGLEIISPKVISDEINAHKLVIEGDNGQSVIKFDNFGNATFAGTITADKIIANQIEGLELLIVDSQTAGVATASATFANASTLPQSSFDLENIEFGNAKVLLDLAVLGKLTADGGLEVLGPAEFKGNVVFRALAEFFGRVIFRNDVEFAGRPTFNKDTAGFAQILKDQNKVEVLFEREYQDVPVVNVNLTLDYQGQEEQIFASDIRYLITQRTTKGFTIILNKVAPFDLEFSWIALAVSDAKTHTSQKATANNLATTYNQLVPVQSEQTQPTIEPQATSSAQPVQSL